MRHDLLLDTPRIRQSPGRRIYHLFQQRDEQTGVAPLIDLPQSVHALISDYQEQRNNQFGLQESNQTTEISGPMPVNSRCRAPHLSADQEESELLHQVALRAATALDAFTQLYTLHHERLRRFCHIFLKCPERVEEVMQEVWLDIWTKASTYRGEAKVTTWIFGWAKHRCYNKWRKEEQKDSRHIPIISAEPQDITSPDTEVSASVIESRVAPESLDPAVTVEVKARQQLLWDAITALSPLDQAMLHLIYREGKSLREVSHILGKPEGTIKRRLSDTRRTLRKELEKRERI